MRKLLAPLAMLVLFGLLVGIAVVAVVARDRSNHTRPGHGSFGVACDVSHTSRDDPIVMPRMADMAHRHAFFGNASTNASSTRASLLAAGTTCSDQQDTAAVWVPVAEMNGEAIVPQRERTYYFGFDGPTDTVPADLRVVAGDPLATGPGAGGVSWGCGIGTPRATHPYDCRPYAGGSVRVDGVIARVDFPTCWDGRLDSPDHRSHLVYPVGHRCPSDHRRSIPEVSVRVHYGIWDPCTGAVPCGPDDASAANVVMRLSGGDYTTMHADLWNTWQQDALDELVDRCIRDGERCGVIVGDG
jgi:uncharacterized protein DUF1996